MAMLDKLTVNYIDFTQNMGFPARTYLTHVSEDPGCPTSGDADTDDFLWHTIELALFGGEDTPCWSPFDEGRSFLQLGMNHNPAHETAEEGNSIYNLIMHCFFNIRTQAHEAKNIN